jgi:hypothetical protein
MRVPLPFGSFWFRFCFFFYKSEQKREARHTHTAKKKTQDTHGAQDAGAAFALSRAAAFPDGW